MDFSFVQYIFCGAFSTSSDNQPKESTVQDNKQQSSTNANITQPRQDIRAPINSESASHRRIEL